jgi:hypothetical protein
MASTLEGDYSKYPELIRGPFCRIAGETCELRQAWLIYYRLFMDDECLTSVMIDQFGPVLGVLQAMLEDLMFLSIARLTDKDSRRQPNLSIWTLTAAVPYAERTEFGAKVDDSLSAIWSAAADIRLHRHKRIAHFDRDVGLKVTSLPTVKLAAFRTVLEMIEQYLNLFFWEFEQTTMTFDMVSSHEITGKAEITALKAHAYDNLTRSGTIAHSEWRRQWKTLSDAFKKTSPKSTDD